MKRLSLFEEENKHACLNEDNNIREVLPWMIGISNNSNITHSVAKAVTEKMTSKELNDFKMWLKLVEGRMLSAESKAKRSFRGF